MVVLVVLLLLGDGPLGHLVCGGLLVFAGGGGGGAFLLLFSPFVVKMLWL